MRRKDREVTDSARIADIIRDEKMQNAVAVSKLVVSGMSCKEHR